MSVPTKRYLGDGVYACFERGGVTLTTDNGIGITNKIFLEPETYSALVEFVLDVTKDVEDVLRTRQGGEPC